MMLNTWMHKADHHNRFDTFTRLKSNIIVGGGNGQENIIMQEEIMAKLCIDEKKVNS